MILQMSPRLIALSSNYKNVESQSLPAPLRKVLVIPVRRNEQRQPHAVHIKITIESYLR